MSNVQIDKIVSKHYERYVCLVVDSLINIYSTRLNNRINPITIEEYRRIVAEHKNIILSLKVDY
jgi:hypothetical protein